MAGGRSTAGNRIKISPWRLTALSSAAILKKKRIALKIGKNVVGSRRSCDIQLPSKRVSREHCTLEVNETEIIMRDYSSTNGTFVNDVNFIQSRCILEVGDIIGFACGTWAIQRSPDANAFIYRVGYRANDEMISMDDEEDE